MSSPDGGNVTPAREEKRKKRIRVTADKLAHAISYRLANMIPSKRHARFSQESVNARVKYEEQKLSR